MSATNSTNAQNLGITGADPLAGDTADWVVETVWGSCELSQGRTVWAGQNCAFPVLPCWQQAVTHPLSSSHLTASTKEHPPSPTQGEKIIYDLSIGGRGL